MQRLAIHVSQGRLVHGTMRQVSRSTTMLGGPHPMVGIHCPLSQNNDICIGPGTFFSSSSVVQSLRKPDMGRTTEVWIMTGIFLFSITPRPPFGSTQSHNERWRRGLSPRDKVPESWCWPLVISVENRNAWSFIHTPLLGECGGTEPTWNASS